MASELKVDKFTGVTTAGSILVTGEGNSTTTNLQQGLNKAWLNMNGTGTIATRDSFNIASITDNGTGDYTGTFTNAMNNDDFVCAGEGGTERWRNLYMFLCAHTKATGSARVTKAITFQMVVEHQIETFMVGC